MESPSTISASNINPHTDNIKFICLECQKSCLYVINIH